MKINYENEEYFLSLIDKGIISVDENGKCINLTTGNELGKKPNQQGYKAIAMKDGEKIRHQLVHRLVHILYNDGFTDDKPLCNHKDGNKWNNHYSNLESSSHSENSIHAYKNGLRAISEDEKENLSELFKGEKGCKAKLTNFQVNKIREKYSLGGHTHRSLAKELGMHHSTIGSILRKETFVI